MRRERAEPWWSVLAACRSFGFELQGLCSAFAAPEGPAKAIEIIRASPNRSESTCRRSLQPLSPIQNNSDLAQGLHPIRPSKVRRSDIYLAPGGVHGTKTKIS